MDGRTWKRSGDRPHFHLRLIAWATRRCERREGPFTTLYKKLAV